jgi:VanZ family protein
MKALYTRRGAVFLFLYIMAVVYGSLYPWVFHSGPYAALRWLSLSSGSFLLDFLANVVFYVPLGAAAFLAFGGGAAGLFFAFAVGFTLSFGVEEAQRHIISRVGDYNDILANSLGTAFGAMAAYAWKRAHRRWIPPAIARRFSPEGLVLAALWLAWNGFLLLPAASRRPLPYVDPPMGWTPAVSEVLGVVILAVALRPRPSAIRKTLAPVLLLWVAIQGLMPFQPGVRKGFSWLPFEGLSYAQPEFYYPLVFGKLFFYAAVVWAMRFRGRGWFWPVLIPLAVLAAGEAAQIYITDRTPETTDLVLMAAGAFLLWMAGPGLWQTQRTGYTASSEVKG